MSKRVKNVKIIIVRAILGRNNPTKFSNRQK